MINYVITGSCAKNCSFCFTDESARKEDTLGEMSIETFSKSLDHVNHKLIDGQVKILGGEPTQHSNFPGIVQEVIKRDLKVDLISNFLFGNDTQQFIVDNIKHFNWFLPNAMELDESNRIKLFKRNYLAIFEAVKDNLGFTKENPRFWLAFTISRDHEKSFDYLVWLIKELEGKAKGIRIGIDLTHTYVINNKSLGRLIDRIITLAERNNIRIVFDCQIPPCLWDTPRDFATIHDKRELACGTCPTDVFPDGSMIRCYPTKEEIKIKSLFDYKNVYSIKKELNRQYVIKNSELDVPDDCKQCAHYMNTCNGICLGCVIGGKKDSQQTESIVKFYYDKPKNLQRSA